MSRIEIRNDRNKKEIRALEIIEYEKRSLSLTRHLCNMNRFCD